MFRRLAELLARMHATGVYHHDLRVGNILVNRDTKELFLIDTDRVTFERPRQLNYIVKNLAQLNLVIMPQITVTDRLRFFRLYQKFAEIPDDKAREIFSRSEARSRYKLLQALPKQMHRTASTLPYSELLALAYNNLYKKSATL
jgi:predicted unusual protein kinase regulating ubiquinone biosynthesis (AarF/ABC1/UbiB family)